MNVDETVETVDEKGRVTLPKSVFELLGLEGGERVRITVEDGRIVIRPHGSREQFIETMEGCISDETKAEDAPSVTPSDVKADWTSDLPNASSSE
ncbi:AbrB/MazE/SpoVT family DNA-binding domain-containing protein [Halovivax gelatinilyticus]|uniref:AbrB/MazE/SpoVT family DNA-binding domain-containing protein n=1 Tax=Halovivax gelatinilyticus TaxID=2961597 RepID=UPI0020CA3F26|nr:AbrB/MazE/SpoVT family DNA-binding domain-containing protein [Halovivax gelatinilyticus]